MTLNAYEYHVFLDFHEVQDDEWGSYRHLYEYLGGGGVPDVREALRELVLQPVLNPFREIANPGYFNYLTAKRIKDAKQTTPPALLDEAAQKMSRLLDGASQLTGFTTGRDTRAGRAARHAERRAFAFRAGGALPRARLERLTRRP